MSIPSLLSFTFNEFKLIINGYDCKQKPVHFTDGKLI